METRTEEKKSYLEPTKPGTLASIRNGLLSTFVPINVAMDLSYKKTHSVADSGVFKKFIDEIQGGLHPTGASAEVTAKLLHEYLNQCLRDQMYTGEVFAFQETLRGDIER